jgi:hypothetical protein
LKCRQQHDKAELFNHEQNRFTTKGKLALARHTYTPDRTDYMQAGKKGQAEKPA